MPIQLSGSGSITGVSTLTSLASLDVAGSVSVGGTLIYDDVTNIDSIGIVTARSDVHVGSALSVTGISTFGNGLHVTGGNVAVGHNNPLNTLHVKGPTGGVSARFTDAVNATVFVSHPSSGKSKIADAGGNYGFEFDTASVNILSGGSERVRVKSDGNVGVGDDNPSVPFNVKAGGASFAGQTTHVKIEDTTSLAANVGGLLAFEGVYNSNGDPACYAMIHGGKTNADNGNYAGYLRFLTRPSNALPQERLRITSDGNALFGGTAVSQTNRQLVVGSNAEANLAIETHNTSASETANIRFYRSRGTAASPTSLVDNDVISQLVFYGHDGTDYAHAAATIKVECDGTVATNQMPGAMSFHTNAGGTSATERLRITSSGVVGINTDVSGNGSGAKLVVGGRIQSNAGGYWFAGANGAEDGWHVQDSGGNLAVVESGVTERLRISSSGNIGINDTDPRTGLTIAKYGTAPTTNANTYSYPAGRWVSTWNVGTTNNVDYWAGFGGGGYAVSSGSVNIALASNHNNTSQQAGMYIAGEATSLTSADFTIGKLVAGSAIGSSDVAGNQRATKSELMRVTGDGKVGINNTNPQTALNVQGTISTGRNLAREVGTVISASTNFNSSRDADNVINGKKNYENGGNDWLTAGNNRDNAWVVIDLGAQYDIDRVVIYNQNEYSDSRREVKRFNLEGSNDNSSWTLLIDDELGKSDAHEPNPGFSFRLPHVSSPGGMHDDSEGAGYRYWKFHMKDFHGSDPYGGIMEIELYGASNAVDSEVSTHSVVASDVYTQTLSAQRLAIGENGALGEFRANQNENVYINAAARFGQNTSDSSGNATRHTGWRMYGYCPDGVSNRLQFTIDGLYGRKSFYYYFPHGSANQAIRFHSNRNSFWTCGFITINGNYSHQNASGMLRYHFTHNANGTSSYGKNIVEDVNIGNTGGNFGMNNSYTFKSWGSNGGSTTSHALELRHLNSNGNGCYVTIELYGNHVYNYMDDLYMTTGHTY